MIQWSFSRDRNAGVPYSSTKLIEAGFGQTGFSGSELLVAWISKPNMDKGLNEIDRVNWVKNWWGKVAKSTESAEPEKQNTSTKHYLQNNVA